jgi:hypothetical protein
MAKSEFDVSEFEPENQLLARQALEKRKKNSDHVGSLEQQGVGLDLTVPRLEFTLNYLVKVGVLTEQQMLECNLAWEEDLAKQLKLIDQEVQRRQQLREAALRKQQAEAGRVAQNGLATPVRALHLPGGRVHLPPPSDEEK